MADTSEQAALQLDRLNQAAIALLDPLIDPQLANQPTLQARRLGDALAGCAQSAERAGVRGLNYLVTLAVPHLHKLAASPSWPQARELLEIWVGDVVAFCAGHLAPDDVDPLMSGLQDLPEFPAVPAQFITLIRRRLAQDAELIAALAAAAMPASQPCGPVDDIDPSGVVRAAPQRPDEPVPVARDELEMLAQALQALADESGELLAELAAHGRQARPELEREWLEVYAERLGHWCNAAGYVGVAPLAELAQLAADSIATWLERADDAPPGAHDRLGWLPAALAGFVLSPDDETASQLCLGLADARWPVSLARDQVPAAVAAITHLRLVGSRQVQALQAAITPSDLSLVIPADADPRVLDNLLIELPPLSARLSESVVQILQGDPQALAEAQRVAHTLKGSANTVGIRGIATLAHQLEDMLALLTRPDPVADPAALALLEEGSDCLAEMSEAVAGQGPAPDGALDIAQRIADWVAAHLAQDDAAAAAGEEAPADSGADDVGSAEPAPATTAVASAPAITAVPSAPAPVAPAPTPVAPAPAAPALASVPAEPAVLTPPVAADESATLPQPPTAFASVVAAEPVAAPQPIAASPPPAESLAPTPAATPSRTEPDSAAPADQDEPLRVSARVLDRMLDLAAEASILLAQAQEQLAQLQETRITFRVGSERLQDLANELERVVDLRSITIDRGQHTPQFDALELDEYDDLHTVSRRIAESGADSKLLDRQLDRQAAALGDAISQLERVQGDLRETVMQSRMVPVATIVPRLQRATRQAARMAQRRVQFDIHGDSTAVDAQLLQSLIDPLTHLLRNAVDHGIEDETQRVQAGKPAAGRIELAFEHTGRELRIRCQDDGRGLDEPAVLARAIERGVVGADARPSPAQVARLVLAPGFSTRDAATQLSGRGIGLDVVHRAVTRLRGTLDIRSESSRGMTIDITLPIALAGLPVLVARTPTHVLALSIRQVEHIVPGAGVLRGDDGEERFVMEQGVMPVRRLDALLGLPRGWFQDGGHAPTVGAVATPRDEVALLVRGAGGELVAVIAPELSQTRRVVVRPLPAWLPPIAGVEGACVLGDGSAAPVIDLPQLLAGAGVVRADIMPAYLPAQRPPVCLVVDDSVSVRRSMEAFLRDLGFEVDSAGDGLEALARLAQRVPDLAIVDLEMPRMNGVELASTMRQDVRSCEVPIIMITSRASEKHRRMAVDAGVDVFLTKPYTEDDLASQIRRCLERKALLG